MKNDEKRSLRIGIDIGGTFTDIVVSDFSGRVLVTKAPSTPHDYTIGIARAVQYLLTTHVIDPESIDEVVHATTVAANAVLEGKGALTGLITTAGFRDVLEFRRIRVPELYNLNYRKPRPLVPRRLRFEVRERLAADGSVRVQLDEGTVIKAAEELKRARIEAVAICLLHAYANPQHERRIADILRETLPSDVFISCSHEVIPEMREYQRTSTTVVNAFLGPLMRNYLTSLQGRLETIGLRSRVSVLQSNGTQMAIASAVSKPAHLVESGPAAGVIAATRIAKQLGLANVITLDVGGTTAKSSMIENGVPIKTGEYEIGSGINLSSRLIRGSGYSIKLPFIDVSEIGAGGGSYVWFDGGGLLKVGPRSAGSVPGPVCYGKGGQQVTLTDALLALGYINPHHLVGGAVKLCPDDARRALESQVGNVLGVPLEDAAYGILRVAISSMVRAVKSVSTHRGRDPRDHALVAFGGNGPILAAAIASDLAIRQVIVPPFPGVLSALGLTVADKAHELVKALSGSLRRIPTERIVSGFGQLTQEAVSALGAEGYSDRSITTSRFVDVRYAGQAYELTVPLAADRTPDLGRVEAAFHSEHFLAYGHKAEGEPVELVAIRVVASVPTSNLPDRVARWNDPAQDDASERMAYFGTDFGMMVTPVVHRTQLAGRMMRGPLIVEEYDATTLVPPGANAKLDQRHNILITLGVGQ